MKALFVLLSLALGTALAAPAQAKLTAGEPFPLVAFSLDDTAVATGPARTLRESNYFTAPQTTSAFGRGNSCHLPLSLFEKTRLAQSCN